MEGEWGEDSRACADVCIPSAVYRVHLSKGPCLAFCSNMWDPGQGGRDITIS